MIMSSKFFSRAFSLILASSLSFLCLGVEASQVSGNSKGSVVVEEFFDYQCPHCRIMLENTDQVVKGNRNVKLVTRVVPLMDRTSWTIARAVLAARKQGKYNQLHQLLMEQREYITEPRLMALAKMAGLNLSKLERDMRSKEISAELNANLSASRRRGVESIPVTFIYRNNQASSAVRFVGDKSVGEIQRTISKL